MAVSFYSVNKIKDINKQTPCVHFEEELKTFLWSHRDQLFEQAKLLHGLDPYGDEFFKGAQIEQVIHVCEELLRQQEFLEELGAPIELPDFLRDLIDLCRVCQKENVALFAGGD